MRKALKKGISKLHRAIIGVEPPKGFLSTLATLVVIFITGTLFYAKEEGWSHFDAFYFTAITITTVGYGDMYPTTTASKLFTVCLIFVGVGIGLYVISTLADSLQRGRQSREKKIHNFLHRLSDIHQDK